MNEKIVKKLRKVPVRTSPIKKYEQLQEEYGQLKNRLTQIESGGASFYLNSTEIEVMKDLLVKALVAHKNEVSFMEEQELWRMRSGILKALDERASTIESIYSKLTFEV